MRGKLGETLQRFWENKKLVKAVFISLVAIIATIGLLAIGLNGFTSKETKDVVENVDEGKTTEKTDDNGASEGVNDEAAAEVVEETEYAAAFIVTINPKLKIYIDKEDVVIKVEALNKNAENLLKSFEWEGLDLQNCFRNLLEEAYEEGFLRDGATVSIIAENNTSVDVALKLDLMKKSAMEVCKANEISLVLETRESELKKADRSLLNGGELEETQDKVVLPKLVAGEKTNNSNNNAGNKPEQTSAPDLAPAPAPKPNPNPDSTPGPDTEPIPNPESEYKLVWEDNFDGAELNRADWNVELHAPGWVNAEWQEYVDSEENIYLEDGNLVLQAIKTTDADGNDYYTSGRINTQNKHDFKYGKFEARLKVPKGMGFLPAFWMMPTDEQFYGQWPKCGEIDIMEVMGQSTDTLHGTIHYGEPHGQRQGTYILDASETDFSEDYHVYTCEWEPGKITWYVDGIKFHEATDWYSRREGFDDAAFPAPFDQPFYMIFNVAVGGSWVGYPDETTAFGDNAQMVVDYVRVYQKDEYDENVEKPEKPEIPDSEVDVNLLNNGDFSADESFTDKKDWEFLTANGGVGEAQNVEINGEKALKITTTNEGTVDYSVQLVQGPIALKQGNKYKISFEAWADSARNMKVLISAPDLNYIRYWGDQTVALTTEKQTFSYEFDMTEAGDANARFEMTFGAMGSTDAVYIDNVRVEKIGTFEITEEEKTVLPDGNYVYNSGFDVGADRMKYWTVDSTLAGVEYCATNTNGLREFKTIVPDTVAALTEVVLKQENTAISGGKKYLFTFDAYGAEVKTVKAVISPKAAGNEVEDIVFDINVGISRTGYAFSFDMPEGVTGADVKFLIGAAGTTYIDNVRVQEDANVINGDFSNGTAGWELYAYTPGDVAFAIDSLDNGSGTQAAAINIANSGSADWHIQLKQPVTLEQGKKYRVSFDAWSTVAREILFAVQRNADKKGGGEWTSYSGDIIETMSTENFRHYSKEFEMTWETDEIADLKFSFGAVLGTQIAIPHTVFIDNVVLEEIGQITTPEEPDPKPEEAPVNIALSDISLVKTKDASGNPVSDGSNMVTDEWTGSCAAEGGKVTTTVTDPGVNPWDVQIQQFGKNLEANCEYTLTFKAGADASKFIQVGLQENGGDYTVYSLIENQNIAVQLGTVEKTYTIVFKMNEAGDSNATLFFNLGNLTEANAGYILTADEDKSTTGEGSGDGGLTDPELIKNGDFANGTDGWSINNNSPAEATVDAATGAMCYNISNVGTLNWHLQLAQSDLNIEQGASYTVSFTIKSSIARQVKWTVMEDGNKTGSWSLWYGGGIIDLEEDVEKTITADITAGQSCSASMFQITMAPDGTEMPLTELVNTPVEHTITIDNVSVVKKE
ncbi:MAG: carbohydrate binding domain-containing protein [Lachnospiraceae bacterium]|nr:carbohydrate binding domain-containing protein [Lachnospiraceae bacterium]